MCTDIFYSNVGHLYEDNFQLFKISLLKSRPQTRPLFAIKDNNFQMHSGRNNFPKMFHITIVCVIVFCRLISTEAFGFQDTRPTSKKYQHVSIEDQHIIEKQLGYLPPNLLCVSARSMETKIPIAIQTYPLGGGSRQRRAKAAQNLTPFPTLFWLTCPVISKAISNLERRGVNKLLEERLLRNEDDSLRQMELCHEEYARIRWNSLSEEDKELLLGGADTDQDEIQENRFQGFYSILRESGVAGTDWKRKDGSIPSVKCLHAHYAHFRSSSFSEGRSGDINIIGAWTHELLLDEGATFL